jgi:hypothetical protein
MQLKQTQTRRPRRADFPSVEGISTAYAKSMNQIRNERSCWRLALPIVIALAVTTAAALVWREFYQTETLRLFSPLTDADTYALEVCIPVYLDDEQVGHVVEATSTNGSPLIDCELKLKKAQRRKVKEGLRRVVGNRAVGLTTEFVDSGGVPLIDGDVVMPITSDERHLRRWGRRLDHWILPATGAGALLILKRLFRSRR